MNEKLFIPKQEVVPTLGEQGLKIAEKLVGDWREQLGSDVEVVLGGSLLSGLFVASEDTKVIDMDVRFLTDTPDDVQLREKITQVTGLTYRKTITVVDWPEGTSSAHMLEDVREVDGLSLPLEIEGCLRNRNYVGWAKYWPQVLSEEELDDVRRKKQELRHDKQAYKAYKDGILAEVKKRVVERGLLEKPE